MVILPEFDIAALFVEFFLLLFAFKKRNLPTLRNRLFLTLVLLLSMVTVADTLAELIDFNNLQIFPRALTYILNALFLSGNCLLTMVYTAYCFALVDFWKTATLRNKRIANLVLIIPLVIIVSLIWFSFLLPNFNVFYITEANKYHRGNIVAFMIPHVVCGMYFLLTLMLLIIYRKHLSFNIIILMINFILVIIFSVLIQLILPNLIVECFAISLTTLGFTVLVQKPEEYVDGTLDLVNQNGFNVMEEENLRSGLRHVCVGIIIDDTVFLTNTYGYRLFTKIMQQVALFLRQEYSFSSVFNLNQSTFALVLKNPDNRQLNLVLDNIKARFRSTWLAEDIEQRLYVRLCVIDCPEDAETEEDVMDIINLVSNDERYRKSVTYACDVDLGWKKQSAQIEHCVRKGLLENLFDVYYQPLYSTAEKRLIGAEALVRLRDDDGNYISPEIFIPIAEKNGTILRIGEFVFESVCKTLSNTDIKKLGIKKIDINLSVAQCMQETLADQIKTINTIYQVPVEILNLEITESASAHTPEILLQNMRDLAAAGYELSMDDYGSGNSNMNYLLNLPFKMIKIDKFIVWAALKNPRAKVALEQTIKMIRSIGMTVLAEGVETKEMEDWLTAAGCDYLQGYLYSKPVPFSQFEVLMKESNADLYDTENDDSIETLEEI